MRYGVLAAIFVVVTGFLLISYLHAQRRIKKGLPPLRYHRWIVASRRTPYNAPQYYGGGPPGQAYGMQTWQPPPPAYGQWGDMPPQYAPPQGGSKALADQNFGRPMYEGPGGEASGAGGLVYPPPAQVPQSRITQ